jgi:hypothetical protein
MVPLLRFHHQIRLHRIIHRRGSAPSAVASLHLQRLLSDRTTMTASFPEAVNEAPPTPSPTFEPFTDLDVAPPQALIDSVKDLDAVPPKHQLTASSAKGSLHKRTISAAIPSTEEVVAVDDGLRKSVRSRKPKTGS